MVAAGTAARVLATATAGERQGLLHRDDLDVRGSEMSVIEASFL